MRAAGEKCSSFHHFVIFFVNWGKNMQLFTNWGKNMHFPPIFHSLSIIFPPNLLLEGQIEKCTPLQHSKKTFPTTYL